MCSRTLHFSTFSVGIFLDKEETNKAQAVKLLFTIKWLDSFLCNAQENLPTVYISERVMYNDL